MATILTIEEFAKKIKTKYPQYQEIPDFDLAKKVLLKHPQYHDLIPQQEFEKLLLKPIPQPPASPEPGIRGAIKRFLGKFRRWELGLGPEEPIPPHKWIWQITPQEKEIMRMEEQRKIRQLAKEHQRLLIDPGRKERFERRLEEVLKEPPIIPPAYREPGTPFGQLWEGLKAGWETVVEPSIGYSTENIGRIFGIRWLAEWGEKFGTQQTINYLKKPHLFRPEDMKPFFEGGFKDPRYYGRIIGELLPFSLTAIGTATVGGLVAGPKGAALGGWGASFSIEQANSYQRMIQEGVPTEKALISSNIYGAIAATIENMFGYSPARIGGAVAGGDILRKVVVPSYKDFLLKELPKFGLTVLKKATVEGGEEVAQSITERVVSKWVGANREIFTKDLIEEFMAGFIGSLPLALTEVKLPRLPEIVPPEVRVPIPKVPIEETTLRERLEEIQKEIHGKEPGTPEFNRLLGEAREIQERISKIRPDVKPSELLIETVEEGKKRKFLETVKKAEKTTEPFRLAIGDMDTHYIPITNQEAIDRADAMIKRNLMRAKDIALSPESVSAEKSAIAIRLIKHFEAQENYDAAIEILDSYDKQLREAGRYIQAASLWTKLSPEILTRRVDRVLRRIGKELTKGEKAIILESFNKIIKMEEGPRKAEAMIHLMAFISDRIPWGLGELFENYRYQNMLSNPRSWMRNIENNLFNTFILRPLELEAEAVLEFLKHPFNAAAREVHFSDTPIYFKTAILNITKATFAFKEALKRGYISEKFIDIGNVDNLFDAVRRSRMPVVLTAFPRFMEAQDKFFTVLISEGEKMRLIKKGISEEIAEAKGKELAEKYLYRERLGMTAKDQALMVRGLDLLGREILRMRRLPLVGPIFRWFAPFVTTPINIGKLSIEFSPFGLIGGKYSREQVSKAFLGSVVMLTGAMFAAAGDSTFLPPDDPRARRLFYDSGKRTMSIRIGNMWIPVWYFGPLALAFSFPAAVKYFYDETRTAPIETDIDKITKSILGIGRIIVSQTPLSGVSGFFQALEGDIDFGVASELAFTLRQAIPLTGLLTYINNWLDPVFRRSRTFTDALKRNIPLVSKELEPFETFLGDPAQRERWMLLLPWDVGKAEEDFEEMYWERIRFLQELEKIRREIR